MYNTNSFTCRKRVYILSITASSYLSGRVRLLFTRCTNGYSFLPLCPKIYTDLNKSLRGRSHHVHDSSYHSRAGELGELGRTVSGGAKSMLIIIIHFAFAFFSVYLQVEKIKS